MLAWYSRAMAGLVAAAIMLVLGFLIYAAWPFLRQAEIELLWSRDWFPFENSYGMAPALLGTLWVVLLAVALALPLAVAAAVLTSELLPAAWRGGVRLTMEVLAGIPSVVYGLLGLWLLLPFLEAQLELLTGRSLLAAGLLLAAMILPTIMVMSEDALRDVPRQQRHAAMSLGLDWNARLWRVLLPQAWPGIRSASLLALGRALGETIAVMLVVGSIDRLPQPWYNLLQPAQTLTSRIGRELAETSMGSLHWGALMASGLLLAVLALIVAGAAQWPGRRGNAA